MSTIVETPNNEKRKPEKEACSQSGRKGKTMGSNLEEKILLLGAYLNKSSNIKWNEKCVLENAIRLLDDISGKTTEEKHQLFLELQEQLLSFHEESQSKSSDYWRKIVNLLGELSKDTQPNVPKAPQAAPKGDHK